MYELAFRFQHACAFNDLSRKFPSVRIALWDNYQREFLEVRSNHKKEWAKINRELVAFAEKKGSRILKKISGPKSYQVLVMTCACERTGSTPYDMVMGSDCLFVPPITLFQGWETYHAVAFDKVSVSKLLRKFGERGVVELVEKKRVESDALYQSSVVPLFDPLSDLTAMQLNALVTSTALGYYRLPRRTSTGKIAAALKIPRTTFQERRKKAESKLMAALTPYVLTYVPSGAAAQ